MNYYSENAEKLFEQYNSLDAEAVHQSWKHLIKNKKGIALDIGAGSGRDARWLADNGWDVVAAEPSKKLTEIAKGKIPQSGSVTWIDDKLPELSKTKNLDYRFNLILISAVWMHLPQKMRERAFRKITDLLAPDGLLIITLRHGADKKENSRREFHSVSREELEHFARQRAIIPIYNSQDTDKLNRNDVSWETCIFQLPDDGTGSLPLLRNIIVNDNKAATYKLGLLRALVKIAESCPGMVISRNDDYVTIPFGLVAMYWIKLYMPLVLTNNLIQAQRHQPTKQTGLGFAKQNHFYALRDFSTYDLRVGLGFNNRKAKIIVGTINDVCSTIRDMPATFITYPGQEKKIFHCEKKTLRSKGEYFQINKESLCKFGTFHIPTKLWSTMSNFACWLEPTIKNEWVRLMMGYDLRYDRNVYDKAMEWDEGKRDTTLVRNRINTIQKTSEAVNCVWSNNRLKAKDYHVDHCFPWSRWANNDLWNLMPTTKSINLNKSEKLPSAKIIETSKSRILNWWNIAYFDSEFKEQFLLEASSALPGIDSAEDELSNIFDALKHQRNRLRVNQQLVEWRL